LPSAKFTRTSEVASSDDIEEVKSTKRSFIKDSSKVKESNMDKTLNDAFGDDDEEVQQHQKKPKFDSRTLALKDKLKEMKIGVVSVNEDEKKKEDVKPK
jgi:hypothetical protein